MKCYAGIGSRDTTSDIMTLMTEIATRLEEMGYILRSGGAGGADSAFERGVKDPKNKEIYLPWWQFNGNSSQLFTPSKEAYEISAKFHPLGKNLSGAPKKFHARNVHQVLGADCKTPSRFIICWTTNGKISGGTGQAMRIAKAHNIPIWNLKNEWEKEDFTSGEFYTKMK